MFPSVDMKKSMVLKGAFSANQMFRTYFNQSKDILQKVSSNLEINRIKDLFLLTGQNRSQ